MTAPHTYRLGHVDLDGRPFLDGATVDDGGAFVLAVRRWTDPGLPEAEPAGPVIVVAADGDIGLDTAPLLRRALGHVLDCRATVCCDSTRSLLRRGRWLPGAGHAPARYRIGTGIFAAWCSRHDRIRLLAVVDPYRIVARY